MSMSKQRNLGHSDQSSNLLTSERYPIRLGLSKLKLLNIYIYKKAFEPVNTTTPYFSLKRCVSF